MAEGGEGGDVAKRSAAGELALSAFGPVAEALGYELAKLPPFAARNIERLMAVFQRKKRSEKQFEDLSARLFKQVFDEAAWSENEIVAEYLGGVLAASGTQLANDRGVAVVSLIRQLSALQLKSHYIFYAETLRLCAGLSNLNVASDGGSSALHVEIDVAEFSGLMGLGSDLALSQLEGVLQHIIYGLAQHDLIGRIGMLGEDQSRTGRPTLCFHPTVSGTELFLWANGSPSMNAAEFFDPALELIVDPIVEPMKLTIVGDANEELEDLVRRTDKRLDEGATSEELAEVSRKLLAVERLAQAHFYGALAAIFAGDVEGAVRAMKRSSVEASSYQRRTGLHTLDRLMILRPSLFDELRRLAEALEGTEGDATELPN